jgi:hypothetical protein
VLNELDDGRDGRFPELGRWYPGFLRYGGQQVARDRGAVAARDQGDDKIARLVNPPCS